ncbi:hypothetical protein Gotur_013216 [Gossypium turneri]
MFQTKVRFLGHYIIQGTITPIEQSIEFASKFSDQTLDKVQLQRFLGSLNYVIDFYPGFSKLCKPLYDRLKKNPQPWTNNHTNIITQIKKQITKLHCLYLADPNAPKIVETDASEIGYGGILKQVKGDETTAKFLQAKSTASAILAQAKTKKEYKKLMAEMLSSLDSESKDESLASSIKTVDLADDTTLVTITRSKKK